MLDRIRRAFAGNLAARVRRHRGEIRRIVAEHHAMTPRLFGSVARGDATEASDVDILVDFTPDAGLLDEIGLRLALADLLHTGGDVVAADSLRGEMRDRVLREAIAL